MDKEHYNFLPVSINICGKKIVVVGGGKVGYHKCVILHRFTDKVTVVSKNFHEGFAELPFECIQKDYEGHDLAGAGLVFICTEDPILNARVKQDAERMHVLASVCDNPSLCDFVSPAVYKDGDLTISVASNAKDVRRSIRVRDNIRKAIEQGKVSDK